MRIIVAVGLIVSAAPSAAQSAPRGAVPPIAGPIVSAGPARELDRARNRIHDARQDQRLSRREARGYRREANAIGTLGERFSSDGLSAGERQELEMRARVLADQAALAGRSKSAGKE